MLDRSPAFPRGPAVSDVSRESNTAGHGGESFSAKVKAGTRTYFIDVQRAAKLWNLSASDLSELSP